MTPDRLTLEQAVGKLAEHVAWLLRNVQTRRAFDGNDFAQIIADAKVVNEEAAAIASQFSTGEPPARGEA